MMCYSDFPVPDSFPNYMHNTKVQKYFEMFAERFKLRDYIRFRTAILNARRAPDFAKTGCWILEVKDLTSDRRTEERFDALLLCTGHHAYKHAPRFKGGAVFKGEILHTHDYR